MTVQWHGKEIISKVKKVSKDNVLRACFLIQADATRDVNVDTGRHRASLSLAVSFQTPKPTESKEYISNKTGQKQMSTSEDGVEKPGVGPGQYVGVVGSNVEYAIYRELDKPSLRNALEKNAPAIEKLFNVGL